MKVTYYNSTRQCTIDNGDLVRGLDSAAANYYCFYCHGSITVQRVEDVWRLFCLRCRQLDEVASKYAGSSRVIVVDESAKKSKSDLFGGE